MLDARRDYLMRQIQELAQLIARLLGLTATSAWAEAESTLAEGYRSLTGLSKEMLERLDVPSLRMLLQTGEKVELVVTLLDEEAKLLQAQGRHADAEALSNRARGLERTLSRERNHG